MILKNCRIFNGEKFIEENSVLIKNKKIIKILNSEDMEKISVESSEDILDLNNAIIAPGFIDLQLNGCGGVLFNDAISRNTLEVMNETNHKYGCTSFLPTLITSPDEKILKSLELIENMEDKEDIGVLGLHIEGPNINVLKKGIHNEKYIRVLSEEIIDRITTAGGNIVKIITIAPEKSVPDQLKKLTNAGIRVSMGHTFATYEECENRKDYYKNATHLFNAMSEFGSREPGVVGYIFDKKTVHAGIIVDGFHASFPSIRVAHDILKESLYLVTDAVSPAGTNMKEFMFEGKRVFHENGKCFGEDGTLGGSALVMNKGVQNLINHVGIPMEEALRMATSYPAHAVSIEDRYGYIKEEYVADIVILSDNIDVLGIIVKGEYKKFS